MQQVTVGLIGCGVMGNVALDTASRLDSVQIAAVADVRKEAADQAAEKYAAKAVYYDGAELLRDSNIQAVIIAMPTCWRVELAMQAFSAGKHVLLEKPVAMNASQVRRMIKARGNLIAGCCSSRYQFYDSTKAATAFIATGVMGSIRLIRVRALGSAKPPGKTPPPWRLKTDLNGGGILMNWGCYDLDYIFSLFGWKLQPALVLGRTWPLARKFAACATPDSDAETHAAAFILCKDGTAISFERGEFAAAREEAAWDIIGTQGSLYLYMTPAEDKKIIYTKGNDDCSVSEEIIWQGKENWQTGSADVVIDFIEAVRQNRPPGTDLEKALLIQKTTDAIYLSARQGKAVEI
ncbi:MAG: Gfo/Idh/MocA family oxidoreductase [Planctomycetota bacterium]